MQMAITLKATAAAPAPPRRRIGSVNSASFFRLGILESALEGPISTRRRIESQPNLIGTPRRLEIAVTHSKQTTEVISNRNKISTFATSHSNHFNAATSPVSISSERSKMATVTQERDAAHRVPFWKRRQSEASKCLSDSQVPSARRRLEDCRKRKENGNVSDIVRSTIGS